MNQTIEIGSLNRFGLWLTARGCKKRNKHLLEQLALWNRDLKPAEEIKKELAVTISDLKFLNNLGLMPNGWHSFRISSTGYEPARFLHLAKLGLLYCKPFLKKINLSDAGRFLLGLTGPPDFEIFL